MNDNDFQGPDDPQPRRVSLTTYGLLATFGVMLFYAFGTSLFQLIAADYVTEGEEMGISPRNFMLSLAAAQVFFLLVPTIRLAARHRLGLGTVLRFSSPPRHFLIYTSLLALCVFVLSTVWMSLQELYLVPDFLRSIYDSWAEANDIFTEHLLVGESIPLLLLGLLTVALVPAICEELFFRGLVQRSFEGELAPRTAIWITALLFALIHMQPILLIPLTGLGLLLGYLAWRSGSILPAILLHLLFNAMQFLTGNLLLSEEGTEVVPGNPDLADGLPGLLLIGGITLIIFVLILRRIGSAGAEEREKTEGAGGAAWE